MTSDYACCPGGTCAACVSVVTEPPALADVLAAHQQHTMSLACRCGQVAYGLEAWATHVADVIERHWADEKARVRAEALEEAARALDAKEAQHDARNNKFADGATAWAAAYSNAARIVRGLARGDA